MDAHRRPEARMSVLTRQLQAPAASDTLLHDGAASAPTVVIGGLVMDIQVQQQSRS